MHKKTIYKIGVTTGVTPILRCVPYLFAGAFFVQWPRMGAATVLRSFDQLFQSTSRMMTLPRLGSS